MDFNIIKDDDLSGNKAKIYSIRDKGKAQTYLEQFVCDNLDKYPQEVGNILQKLHTMGHETGCEHNLFKHYEGKGGDGVVCIKDDSGRFRLYCMYFGEGLVVCGSGGRKGLSIRAYQEDEVLDQAAQNMKDVAAVINRLLQKGYMEIEKDGTIINYLEEYYD